MANINHPIQLLQVEGNQIVDAILTTVTEKHLTDARILWEPELAGTGKDDEYWNWEAKSRSAKILPGDELYAIESDGIGLHALPSAIAFYKKLKIGLLDCGPDPDEPDNLVYVETLRRDI